MSYYKGEAVSGSQLYKRWIGIKSRVNNPRSTNYKNYGGRGIKICYEWYDFMNFKKWAEFNGYAHHLTIDRINPDGDYCPENCRWITKGLNSKSQSRKNELSCIHKKGNGFYVQINYLGKIIYIGYVSNIEDAIALRNTAIVDIRLGFVSKYLNKPKLDRKNLMRDVFTGQFNTGTK